MYDRMRSVHCTQNDRGRFDGESTAMEAIKTDAN